MSVPGPKEMLDDFYAACDDLSRPDAALAMTVALRELIVDQLMKPGNETIDLRFWELAKRRGWITGPLKNEIKLHK